MTFQENTTHFGFQSVAWDEKEKKVGAVFHSVAKNYDLMNDLMSIGIHRLWKRLTIELSGVRAGQVVLDLAGGSGDLTRLLCQKIGPKGLVVLADADEAAAAAQHPPRVADPAHVEPVRPQQRDQRRRAVAEALAARHVEEEPVDLEEGGGEGRGDGVARGGGGPAARRRVAVVVVEVAVDALQGQVAPEDPRELVARVDGGAGPAVPVEDAEEVAALGNVVGQDEEGVLHVRPAALLLTHVARDTRQWPGPRSVLVVVDDAADTRRPPAVGVRAGRLQDGRDGVHGRGTRRVLNRGQRVAAGALLLPKALLGCLAHADRRSVAARLAIV